MNKQIVRNQDVPPETIIRQLQNEINKLKREKGELKNKLDCKEQAIKAFKKWQSKVAEYKWEYWIHEGIKLMDTPPDESLRKALAGLLGANRILDQWKRRVDEAYKSYDKARKKFNNRLNEQQ